MKKGDKVKMVNCAEADDYPDKVWTVVSEPWEVCKTMVVKLEGKRGGFAVDCLRIVRGAE